MKEGNNEALRPLGESIALETAPVSNCTKLDDVRDEKGQRRLVVDRMTRYFRQLLRMDRSDGVRWTGTMTDLVESAHIVWLTGRILAPDGRPMTFADIIRRACWVLHRREPSNAHSLLCHATERKGIRSCSVLTRYVELVFRARLSNPFSMDVGYCRHWS